VGGVGGVGGGAARPADDAGRARRASLSRAAGGELGVLEGMGAAAAPGGAAVCSLGAAADGADAR
jgi:hypothetical protein